MNVKSTLVQNQKELSISKKDNDLSEYGFNQFTTLKEKDGDRLYYRVKPEFGCGVQILYKIVEGMYLIYTNQHYKNNIRSDPDSYNNIIMMYQILSGEIRMNLKNHKTVVIRKDDIVNFAGVAQFDDSFSDEEWIEAIGIFGYYDKLHKSFKKLNFDTNNLEKYYSQIQGSKKLLVYKGDMEFMSVAKELKDLILKDNRFLIKIKTLELFYYGIVNYNKYNLEAKQKFDSMYIDKIFAVKRMIDENPNKNYSIAELAKKCDISSTYFKKIFKVCFDIQPYKYVITKRLEKSKQLLEHSNMKISDIALEMKFASSSKFSNIFKKKYGFLPSEYRKNIKRK